MMPFRPLRNRVSASSISLADLFANGEVGDWWRFDVANTDAADTADNIHTATGLVNGLLLTDPDPTRVPEVGVDGNGNEYANFNGGFTNCERLAYDFGTEIAQPVTIIVCCYDDSIASHGIISGHSATSRMQISTSSGNVVIAYAGLSLDSLVAEAFGLAVLTVEFNGASSKFRKNGTQTNSGNAGTQSTSKLMVGANYDATAANTYTVNIYSVLFIDRLLTTEERDRAERLMASHANITPW